MAGMILQFDFGGRAPGGQPPVILVAVAVAVVVVVALVLLARRALSGVPTARRNRGDRDQWNRARRTYPPIPCDEPDGAGRGADR